MAFLQDRRFLGLLIAIGVVFLLALTLVNFSGAYFSSTSRSPGNQFAAGAVAFELSETGAVVDGDKMLPGDVRVGTQVVTNLGHRADLRLAVHNLDTGSPLTEVLDVEVRQTDPNELVPIYDGPLAGLDRVALGTLANSERRTYKITVTWPAREDGLRLRGTQTSLDFDWQMESD